MFIKKVSLKPNPVPSKSIEKAPISPVTQEVDLNPIYEELDRLERDMKRKSKPLPLGGAGVNSFNFANLVKEVECATTANIALSGLLTVDGVTLVNNNRVLVKNQTIQGNNGIYTANSGAWARAGDANSNSELTNLSVYVSGGTVNNSKHFYCTNAVIGTSVLFTELTDEFTKNGTQVILNIPDANGSTRGLVSGQDQSWQGMKTFTGLTTSGVTFLLNTTAEFNTGSKLNINTGGELNLLEYTEGSILFLNSNQKVVEDNANFFWDNTNNRLGIGTATPTARLDISANTSGASSIHITPSASTASTPNDGDVWTKTNDAQIHYFYKQEKRIVAREATLFTDVTVSDTTTKTTLFVDTISENSLKAGTSIRYSFAGVRKIDVGDTEFILELAGVEYVQFFTSQGGTSSTYWTIDGEVKIRADGVSGSFVAKGLIHYSNLLSETKVDLICQNVPVPIDTTIDNLFKLRVDFENASEDNSVTLQMATVEIV